MDWQLPSESIPTDFVSEEMQSSLRGAPPVTGAWRDGDHLGSRLFSQLGVFTTENGPTIPHVRIAYEKFGNLNAEKSNAILLFHALTGDSHVTGAAGAGHPTAGWWSSIVGSGRAIDPEDWCVIVPNVLGGCQGSTGPSSPSPDGKEWGSRFPYLTIRDQVNVTARFVKSLEIERFAAVIGGSMGGMHALEWAIMFPNSYDRLALIASSAATSADQLSGNSLQQEAIKVDPNFYGGDYYDADEGPVRGLALARRMALLNYRSSAELNGRFNRAWQSHVSPLGDNGRFAIESYLDFHGNKFTRRFDANSYLVLVDAMNSHDIERNRESRSKLLSTIRQPTLILGITSDRLFPIEQQKELASHIPGSITGDRAFSFSSKYGHDGFLIEEKKVGQALRRLLGTSPPG